MASTFEPWSFAHALVMGSLLALAWRLTGLRRARSGDQSRQRRMDIGVGTVGLIVWLAVTLWWLMPANFRMDRSLPLHVCDLASLLGPVALLTSARPARAMLYFWGLGLCSQAFVTPTLTEGPAEIEFWLFWGAHAVILVSAVYDVAARGFRPTWEDLRLAFILSALYATCIVPFDMMTNSNYGYLGPGQPEQPTLIDVLGPWPARVPVIVALGYGVMTVIWLPWKFVVRGTGQGGERAIP